MASIKSHVVYEPIDPRSLSKKEKTQYLNTAMKKPRLERRPSITDNDSDSEADFEADSTLEAAFPQLPIITEVDRKSAITTKKRQWQSPRERLEAELRKLDGFWSFKPIPRDTTFVRQNQSRTTLSPASTPSGSEVYLPSSHPPSILTLGEDTNSFEGRPESQSITEETHLNSSASSEGHECSITFSKFSRGKNIARGDPGKESHF
ncbi:hypothetical protein EV426DRAFT_715504 [Tirmania nivea]|nr:hypothetical protein EV426DRAFT_715504 [Tirmania nivea]